jgi:hypothetical protein
LEAHASEHFPQPGFRQATLRQAILRQAILRQAILRQAIRGRECHRKQEHSPAARVRVRAVPPLFHFPAQLPGEKASTPFLRAPKKGQMSIFGSFLFAIAIIMHGFTR